MSEQHFDLFALVARDLVGLGFGDVAGEIARPYRFPLSPRVRALKRILDKLEPRPAPELVPPPRAWVNSSIGRKRR